MPPLIAFSFDADNLDLPAAYLKDRINDHVLDGFYANAGERLVGLLSEFGIRATFFVIGKDLAFPNAKLFFTGCMAKGHEIANHTQNHSMEFEALSVHEQRHEIFSCHSQIKDILGVSPKGFRCGAMQRGKGVLTTLADLDYLYDASIIPSWFNLASWVVFWLGSRSFKYRPKRGLISSAMSPRNPYTINLKGKTLASLPTSVSPISDIPLYATYHLVHPKLSFIGVPALVAKSSLLIFQGHILDMVDPKKDGVTGKTASYPIFRVSLKDRIECYRRLLDTLLSLHKPVTMKELAQKVIT